MKKNYKNKISFLAAIIFHTVLIIGYFSLRSAAASASSYLNMGGLMLGAINGFAFILAGICGVWTVLIQLWISYAEKENNLALLVNAIINTVAGLLGILLFMSMTSSFLINCLLIVAIIGVIYNVILVLCLEGIIKIEAIEIYLPSRQVTIDVATTETTESIESTNQIPTVDVAKVNGFFKSKVGKGIIGAIIAFVVVFAGYKVWDNFFNYTTLDLFEGVGVSYSGNDGEGYADIEEGNIDYDKTNKKIKSFVDDIYYTVENNGDLSNGETITVTVKYSEKTAKSLNIKVKEKTKTFTVSGLVMKYKSASEIDKTLYDSAKTAVLEKAKAKNYDNSTNTFYKAYYAVNSDKDSYYDNYLVFVFKNEYKSYSGEAKVKYVYYEVEFDSSFTTKSLYLSPYSLYKDSSYDYANNEEDVLKALEAEYEVKDGYKLEEMK